MYSYHFAALSADVGSRAGSVVGRLNITVILKEIAKREKLAGRDATTKAKAAAEQLKVYFDELCSGMGPEACRLAEKQELKSVLLGEAEAAPLMKAEKKTIRTTINKSAAQRLADTFGDRGLEW